MSRGIPKNRLAAVLVAVAVAAAGAALLFRHDLLGARARGRYLRVVLVTLDTLHVNYAGPYNEAVTTTPVLDRFAAQGVTFERAYTTVPITLPSHSSLFTGRLPADLGVMVNGDRLADEVETLAELLARYGYRTGAVTSLGVLNRPANLAQGFEHYDDDETGEWGRWYRTADEVVGAARGWVSQVAGDPFFLWLHLSDPHEPYLPKEAPPDVRLSLDGEPVGEWTLTTKERHRTELLLPPGRHELAWQPLRQPRADDYEHTALVLEAVEMLGPELEGVPAPLAEEVWLRQPHRVELRNPGSEPARLAVTFRGRTNAPPPSEVLAAYPVEVAYMDRWLGEFERLVDELGGPGETLWVVVSDHGEGLFRFGSIGHATYTQEDQLRIVWMLKGPGIPAGVRVAEAPALVDDVMPTLLDLLGLPVPDGLSGGSRAGCWQGGACSRREEWWAYGASVSREEVTALAGYRWPYKLLWQNRRRSGIFDVVADPAEAYELGRIYRRARKQPPPEFEQLRRALERHQRALQVRLSEREAPELNAETLEMLRGLGYIN